MLVHIKDSESSKLGPGDLKLFSQIMKEAQIFLAGIFINPSVICILILKVSFLQSRTSIPCPVLCNSLPHSVSPTQNLIHASVLLRQGRFFFPDQMMQVPGVSSDGDILLT